MSTTKQSITNLEGKRQMNPAPDTPLAPVSRRQLLGFLALLSVALTASARSTSEETPGSVAWSRIPEAEQIPHYRLQQWLEPGAYEISQARRLRAELSRLDLYRSFCHDPHPVTASKFPVVEQNQRAALHDLVDQLDQADTDSLFQIARLLSQVPLDEATLASSQTGSCQVCNPPWERKDPKPKAVTADELRTQIGFAEMFIANLRGQLVGLGGAG